LVDASYARCDVLETLKKFCQNGIDVEQIDKETREKIVSTLIDRAFIFDIYSEDLRRNSRKPSMEEHALAFDIIEMLNVREGPGFVEAKRYIQDSLEGGRESTVEGPSFFKVGSWLAEDNSTRDELIEMTERILAEAHDDIVVTSCKDFLDKVLFKKSGS
jgi:hypothetical protein